MGLTYEPSCVQYLRTLPPAPKKAIRAALDLLDEDPRPRGLDWKRLETSTGSDLVYRLRVGDYRVVYVLRGAHTHVAKIFHRNEGYRWLERLGF